MSRRSTDHIKGEKIAKGTNGKFYYVPDDSEASRNKLELMENCTSQMYSKTP